MSLKWSDPSIWGQPTTNIGIILAATRRHAAVQVNNADVGNPDEWMQATRQDRSSIRHWIAKGCHFRICVGKRTTLEDLSALSDAATPGPWSEGGSHREIYTNSVEISGEADGDDSHYVITDMGGIAHPEDQAFIVACVNYVRSELAKA